MNISNDNDNISQNILQYHQLKNKLEFNQHIIQERHEEIQQIYTDVMNIHEIFTDLDKLVNEHNERINQFENNIDDTVKYTKDSVIQIQKANDYHKSWFSRRNSLILMSIAGLAVNVPVTILFGLKAGIVSGISTIGLSTISTLFIK